MLSVGCSFRAGLVVCEGGVGAVRHAGGAESGDDALERGPGADDEPERAEEHDDCVLDDHSDALGARHVVPVGAALDERGEGQAQRRQA